MEVFGIVEKAFVIFGNFAEIEWCDVMNGGSVSVCGFDNFHGMFPPCGE
jgi:hypothetical protein